MKAGGLKYDTGKPPMELLPHDSLVELAMVLKAGEVKYSAGNWTRGIEMRRLIGAAYRHLGEFNSGRDYDEETKTLHIANAAVNLLFAIWMYKNKPELDNRWLKKDLTPNKAIDKTKKGNNANKRTKMSKKGK